MNLQKSIYDLVIINGQLESADQLATIPADTAVIYEVIRLISGVPLFIEAHLQRMSNSLRLAGIENGPSSHSVKMGVQFLAEACAVENQNIRLNIWKDGNGVQWTGYFVESHYPDAAVYDEGIPAGLLSMVRDNPNAKVWQADLKETVAQLCHSQNLYEMILVDAEGVLLEGSRSNLFFICGDRIITAPDCDVLEGITRMELLEIIQTANIPLEKRPIKIEELETFDGAFLTGSSIHLLPISQIDSWRRESSKNPLLMELMGRFHETVQGYVKTYQAG